MKKILFVAVLFFLIVAAAPVSAGMEGIWTVSAPDNSVLFYAPARENAGTLIIALLPVNMDTWHGMWGPFNGTSGHMETFASGTQVFVGGDLVIASDDAGTFTITSCVSNDPANPTACDGMVGAVLSLKKVF